MKVTITSKNNEKAFNDSNVINIGSMPNCHFKINPGFDLLISLQKLDNGKWKIINNLKSDKVLFRGQPIGASIEIGSLCKLMLADSDEFISIKITAAGTNPKIVPGSLELANRKNAERLKRAESKKTISMIEDEELNEEDIETLYGSGAGVQAKIKIDRKKSDIERRRALITKEIAYKSNYLRQKLGQNEIILSVLNAFIGIVPLTMAYILKDIIAFGFADKALQSRILFLVAVCFIIITCLLKQGQFLVLQNNSKGSKASTSSKLIERLCLICSGGIFAAVLLFAVGELAVHRYNLPVLIPQMLILCSFLCIFLGVFSGFTKNIIAESGEELKSL